MNEQETTGGAVSLVAPEDLEAVITALKQRWGFKNTPEEAELFPHFPPDVGSQKVIQLSRRMVRCPSCGKGLNWMMGRYFICSCDEGRMLSPSYERILVLRKFPVVR